MVEDRITDARRIAQLLASEVEGLERGGLADVVVVDADRDAAPAPDGTHAYGIAVGDDRVATVALYPGAVRVAFDPALDATGVVRETADAGRGLRVADDEAAVVVETGAAVKRAADVVAAVVGDAMAR